MKEGESFSAEAEDSPLDEEELGKDDHGECDMDENDDVHTPASKETSVPLSICFDCYSPTGAYTGEEEEKEEELAERSRCHAPEMFGRFRRGGELLSESGDRGHGCGTMG